MPEPNTLGCLASLIDSVCTAFLWLWHGGHGRVSVKSITVTNKFCQVYFQSHEPLKRADSRLSEAWPDIGTHRHTRAYETYHLRFLPRRAREVTRGICVAQSQQLDGGPGNHQMTQHSHAHESQTPQHIVVLSVLGTHVTVELKVVNKSWSGCKDVQSMFHSKQRNCFDTCMPISCIKALGGSVGKSLSTSRVTPDWPLPADEPILLSARSVPS